MSRWTTIAPWKVISGSGQKVAFTSAAALSVAVGAETHALFIAATSDCHIQIGAAPTATVTECFIKGGSGPVVLSCNPGDKVSVIQDTAAGNLFISELTH